MTAEIEGLGLTQAQKEEIRSAVRRALEPLRVEPPILMPDWADRHFYLSAESSGAAGRWRTLHYQRGMLLLMGNDDVRQLTIMKAARIGYTKCLMICLAYAIRHRKRTPIVFQPTDSAAKRFSKTEIDPMIRDVPAMSEAMLGGLKRNSKNTLDQKQFDSANLYILGGTSPDNFRMLTADLVAYDELEAFVRDVGGEGSAVALGDTRITQSPYGKSIRGSTPNVAGDSYMEDCLTDADEVFDFYPKCTHCGEWVPFKWRHLQFTDYDAATTRGVCDSCGALWEFREHHILMTGGRWMSESGIVIENDGTLSQNGERVPAPRHAAMRPWAALSPYITWADIVAEFLAARSDPPALKVWTNTRLGELYVEERESLDGGELMERAEAYTAEAPEWVQLVTAGADVQMDRVEIQISGWGPDERHASLDYVVLRGEIASPETKAKLAAILDTKYRKPDGTALEIRFACIDSGYMADEVYAFCRRDPMRYFPVKGRLDGPLIDFPRKRARGTGVYLVWIGTTTGKNVIFARLKSTDPQMYHWPRNDKHDADYFKQLTAEERRQTYSHGRRVWRWTLPGGRRNEVLDCNLYALAACRIAQQQFHIGLTPPPETPNPAPDDQSGGQWIETSGGDWL